ncbi:MAG TPA: hypothetical protein PK294_11215 [Ignavibacteria bacterium]|nr:hypothetical protein [Ignavibacteria bacterium]HRB00995.1 hypothetical protein [Ignavibacteria bacterium]
MSLSVNTDPHFINMVKIKLKGKDPLVINGSITGRTYIFKSTGDINWVDRRDAGDFEFIKDIITI